MRRVNGMVKVGGEEGFMGWLRREEGLIRLNAEYGLKGLNMVACKTFEG